MRRRAMETAGTLTSLVPIRSAPNPLNLPALRQQRIPAAMHPTFP